MLCQMKKGNDRQTHLPKSKDISVLLHDFWSVRYSCGLPRSREEMYCDVIFAQRKIQLLSTLFKALKHEHFEGEYCYIDLGSIFSTEILCSNSIKNAATDICQLELGVRGQCWVQAL